MTERDYFTAAEARAKVGRKIRSLVPFSGVPQETTGRVVRADPAGQTKPAFGQAREIFDVGVQWDLPREPLQIGHGLSAGEPFVAISGGKPLIDWFSKDEYERYLEELDDEGNPSAAETG